MSPQPGPVYDPVTALYMEADYEFSGSGYGEGGGANNNGLNVYVRKVYTTLPPSLPPCKIRHIYVV